MNRFSLGQTVLFYTGGDIHRGVVGSVSFAQTKKEYSNNVVYCITANSRNYEHIIEENIGSTLEELDERVTYKEKRILQEIIDEANRAFDRSECNFSEAMERWEK